MNLPRSGALLVGAAVCLLATSCKRSAGDHENEAGAPKSVPSGSSSTSDAVRDGGSDARASAARDEPLIGEWERATEPYKGLRVTFESASGGIEAVVSVPAPLSDERVASQTKSGGPARATAELECQRSLWTKGERVVGDVRRVEGQQRAPVFDGNVVVRDWGLVAGRCRHADSTAKARLTITGDGDLSIDVTRHGAGKPVTQLWKRVAGAP